MKQNDWKIIYSSYEGVAKQTIRFLSKEAGKYIIRENGVYRIYVLPCEKEGAAVTKNAFFVGFYNESPTIRNFVRSEEIKDGGFLVKVVKNPDDEEGRFVILTANDERELFYAAVSFIDDYIPEYAPKHGANKMPELMFDSPLPEYSHTEAPANATRSIFTWGHSINDFRLYIDNMARLKFNELIIWNDFVPLNIRDVIDYAHSYGIKVNLGYSWGWIDGCNTITDISDARLDELKALIIEKYEREYAPVGCDGIYFQSFTERGDEYIGGRLIAEAVTTLVNNTAGELLAKYPTLKLQFGLHALSVNKRLEEIAKVDTRVEILWEDCGSYPYHYNSFVESEESFERTLEFTKKLLELRGGVGVGLVFKGVMMLDWQKFVYQSGPYVLGENSYRMAEHDRGIRRDAWRIYSANWMKYGHYFAKMERFIGENKKSPVDMCMAGTFDGEVYLPFALAAEMLYKRDEKFEDTLGRVSARDYISLG